MQDFSGLKDGETTIALVCFTDIARFTHTAKSLSLQQTAALLKRISAIISKYVGRTTGRVVKYIGDASLLVFPQEYVNAVIRELLAMRREIEEYFGSHYPDLSITFSTHITVSPRTCRRKCSVICTIITISIN